jgi:hypothetical protein
MLKRKLNLKPTTDSKPSLQLEKEAVRTLSDKDLEAVAGGTAWSSTACGCVNRTP